MILEPNTIPYYNDQYQRKCLHSGNPENRRRFERIYQLTTGKKILDVGCGEGYLVNMLTGRGFNATGIDFSSVAISRARKGEFSPSGKFKTIGNFYIADIKKSFPFPNDTFDNVILAEIIEHFDSCDFLFAEAKRVLKPQGRIILTVPSYRKFNKPEHKREFTYNTLKSYLDRFGKSFVEHTTELHFIATVDMGRGI